MVVTSPSISLISQVERQGNKKTFSSLGSILSAKRKVLPSRLPVDLDNMPAPRTGASKEGKNYHVV